MLNKSSPVPFLTGDESYVDLACKKLRYPGLNIALSTHYFNNPILLHLL